MGFNLVDAATTAASKFINKKLANVNLAGGASTALGKASEIANSLTGGANTLKPKPGVVSDDVDNNVALDINGILETGKDLLTIAREPGKPFPNELSQFASYDCLWTLSVLSSNAINFPDETYRKGIYGPILVKSGGTGSISDAQAVSLNNFKSESNPKGIYDAFIDNVKISGVIGFNRATGNTNATLLSFNITEPYSVGLFFQNVQVAAWQAGWLNWLDMPMLLSLEFKGHLSANQQNFSAPLSKKHIPLKLHQISMRISGQGCVYDCQAHPWNEQAFSTDNNEFKTDLTIEGGTVQQMLQTGTRNNGKSLQNVVNVANDERADKAGAEIADRILILFPIDGQTGNNSDNGNDNGKPPGATTSDLKSANKQANLAVYKKLNVDVNANTISQKEANLNPIGKSVMGFDTDLKKVEKAFGKDNVIYDQATGTYTRGDLTVAKGVGEAKFKNKTSVVDAINQVILASDYGRKALDPANIDSNNKVNWWKIETQVYVLPADKPLKKQQRYPILTVFRVIPFKVDYTNFQPADQRPPPKKIEEKKLNAIKKYDYLYTGKNTDILDFTINFDSSFYMALNADSGKNNESIQQDGNKTTKDNTEKGKKTNLKRDFQGQLVADAPPNNGSSGMASTNHIIKNTATNMGAAMGGPSGDDPSTIAARQFQRAMNTGPNMIMLDMKILGDPFYLGDSGMGNYTAQSTNIPEMNADGAINNQDGEVYILVNFRNPIDINVDTGFYEFGKGKVVPQFSGLYKVIKTESQFDKNLFTQQLTLVRMNNQDFKENGDGQDTSTTGSAGLFSPDKN
jgi:hypothetical protein